MASELISRVQVELIKNADKRTKLSADRFFKEKILSRGVRAATVSLIAKKFFPRDKDRKEIFGLCEELFKTGFLEESFVASQWSYEIYKLYKKSDLEIFAEWIKKYVSNWATCDTFCNHTVGEIVIMYPELIDKIKEWSRSNNSWVKRAASVSLIIPAKKGLFKAEILEIAKILLTDNSDMVQKGYGWMLKVLSQSSIQNQKEVFNFVVQNRKIMPRTALRYAIEKMPTELKTVAMEKS